MEILYRKQKRSLCKKVSIPAAAEEVFEYPKEAKPLDYYTESGITRKRKIRKQ